MQFPELNFDKNIISSAEDMKEIPDNSVDAVVGTYIMCSIENRDKALKEIRRVLKKVF